MAGAKVGEFSDGRNSLIHFAHGRRALFAALVFWAVVAFLILKLL
jgi:hypothetical protein